MHTRTKKQYPEVVETKDFAALVISEAGKNKLQIKSPVWYQHQLNKFKEGENVTLYVSSRKPKRTVYQNNFYWGVYLPLIAKETGEHNIERLHKLFSGKFLTLEIVEVLGEKVRIVKSTAKLSKLEFGEYIMNIEAETGIQAPSTEGWYD